MPHQCVRCNTFYPDGSADIIKGCSCGGKMFFFVKKSKLEKADTVANLSKKEKDQIEKDIYEIIGDKADKDNPIVLDLESVNIIKPGKFELDLVHLFNKKQPVIYKLEDGKYMIDIAASFQRDEQKQ